MILIKKNCKFGQKGFTLTEILISLLLISIMLLPLTGLFINSFQQFNLAGEATKAVYLAQGLLEESLNEDYSFLISSHSFQIHPQFPMYEYRINILPYSGNTLYKITVELREINKPEKIFVLNTLRSKRKANEFQI